MRLLQFLRTISKQTRYVLAMLALSFTLSLYGQDVSDTLTLWKPIILTPASSSVRAGESTRISATENGALLSSGYWTVIGGNSFGTINSSGQYTAPAGIPSSAVATVHFVYGFQSADTTLQLLNPIPAISGTSVQTITSTVTPLIVEGAGFVPGSQILVGGAAKPTTYLDSSHLAVTMTLPSPVSSSIALQVSNPVPGAATSSVVTLPVSLAGLTISPTALAGGNLSVTLTYPAGIPAGASILLDGVLLGTTGVTSTTITANGYLAPWKVGVVDVALALGSLQLAQLQVPINTTAVPFDTAARFATQAGFGTRLDVMMHIQQIGLAAYVDEQEQTTPDPYNIVEAPRSHFLRATLNANDLLRKRMGWAFQVIIPEAFNNSQWAEQPWETTLEAHAFGTYRQILEDATSDSQIANLLSLANNFVSTNPNTHPNQNFGREIMQLMSIGPVLLNEDGTPALDSNGLQQATYTQNDVVDSSKVLTGWTYPASVNPAFTSAGVDASLPLVSVESGHDHGPKTILGTTFAAGQSALQDRSQLLDTLFNHPNLPPFISRLLIQRLVKSQPSSAYVKRVVQVFKDNGNGVRGDLGAVVKAILLDPEARAGDTTSTPSDGFVQDPLYQQIAAMGLLGMTSFDDQPTYVPSQFKENWWNADSIFSYFSPSYIIPGTAINSPEFQLIDTITVVQRMQLLWGMVTATDPQFPWPSRQLFTTFPNLTSMMDAMNHILFHGAMPQATHDAIVAYCSTISDPNLQLQSAVFLALNSDNNNVVQ